MRTPYRKPGKYSQVNLDPFLTPEKLEKYKAELDKLKHKSRPFWAGEVARFAEMGDFSENAEYQHAKGRLRGINSRILYLQNYINKAIIIEQSTSNYVKLGNKVTVSINGTQKMYQILGSQETDPSRNIISQQSPIGSALLGRKCGDTVTIELANKKIEYTILKIE